MVLCSGIAPSIRKNYVAPERQETFLRFLRRTSSTSRPRADLRAWLELGEFTYNAGVTRTFDRDGNRSKMSSWTSLKNISSVPRERTQPTGDGPCDGDAPCAGQNPNSSTLRPM